MVFSLGLGIGLAWGRQHIQTLNGRIDAKKEDLARLQQEVTRLSTELRDAQDQVPAAAAQDPSKRLAALMARLKTNLALAKPSNRRQVAWQESFVANAGAMWAMADGLGLPVPELLGPEVASLEQKLHFAEQYLMHVGPLVAVGEMEAAKKAAAQVSQDIDAFHNSQ
ncbi:hypothetical protein [Devosia enhydra]|nr:hypothetical protein [Devosia enhydra]